MIEKEIVILKLSIGELTDLRWLLNVARMGGHQETTINGSAADYYYDILQQLPDEDEFEDILAYRNKKCQRKNEKN